MKALDFVRPSFKRGAPARVYRNASKFVKTRKGRASLTALVLLGACLGGTQTTAATFTSQSRNPGNVVASGTVIISDNDSGSALANASGLGPNASVTSCIRVTYTGSVPSTVRLYGMSSGALSPYVTMTITRGNGMGTFPSCTGFTPDSATYVSGQSQGVIWRGTLDTFPSTYGTGVIDPPTGAATWTTNTERVYRVRFDVSSDNNAGSKSVSTTLTWQAQNT